ncbi:hypothetical protein CARUB_v10007583mg [Capsella rubella]|uniref:Knottin scorpion toxin-like domain-containing protein n=1 Tax=Capsella rubella TaxID=81985 RepID=R0GQ06_9BRAS|nr:hypothetical protein CARUB_v10007583mg [Capsella rubella]
MSKLLYSYMFISILVLSACLALAVSEGEGPKRCSTIVNLSKPCNFQECKQLCVKRFDGDGLCPVKNKNICACEYDC